MTTEHPFNLPDDHWILAQSKEDRVRRMILYRYDIKAIAKICAVEREYVQTTAEKFGLNVRDRIESEVNPNPIPNQF